MNGTWCREMGMVGMRIKNGVRWVCGEYKRNKLKVVAK